MTREEIIRDEANQFGFEYVEHYANGYQGHKDFIEKVREELLNHYDPEAKMIYLDQMKLNIQHYAKQHSDTCTEEDCSKDKIYSKMLYFLKQEIDELPKILKSKANASPDARTQVFISYSHKDKVYLDDLKRHFKPLEDRVLFWDDTQIEVGQKWKEQISLALQNAKIAILLVSADFFNSSFILQDELPPLLQLAETEGATIVTVILKPCLFEEYPQLNQYQALNSPSQPISSLDETAREFMWVELVRQVKMIINKE